MSLPLLNETVPKPISRVDRSLSVRELMRKFGISEALTANITEFAINRPGSYWIEDSAGWREVRHESLSLSNLQGLATAIAVFNQKKLDRDNPIASLTLPDGERCQIVLPPACEDGTVSMTIRKPSTSRFSLDRPATSYATASVFRSISRWASSVTPSRPRPRPRIASICATCAKDA
ncbi:ATPase, T2SS/T4P/T4SS family [Herbaspirillum seropedicae]|uniref:ATPase, T2SS/T4P/T4SS family n=1 Tax=Herbaspirillum seropedicae TaxID=964 RepID=UPI003D968E37